uniref:gamma-glutamylcyclotransferase n=1 Tax=Strigamia maritima TaxID=126957 RepID=T1IZ91_STRMM
MQSYQEDSFLYFAYGSNMLTERIRINNPSARKVAIAFLQHYRLDFNLYGKAWHGAVATIVPDHDNCVWGVVWQISSNDMVNLDKQEFGYDAMTVLVHSAQGCHLQCRSYAVPSGPRPVDARPSPIYKNVIIKGAIEHHLPQDYVDQLNKIDDNGYSGPVSINLSIDTLRNG